MIARRVVVQGTVQGVFFRDWTVRTARATRVFGWVRNCPDGTVEAHLEGPASAVESMTAHLHRGSPAARVLRVEGRDAEPEGFTSFQRRR